MAKSIKIIILKVTFFCNLFNVLHHQNLGFWFTLINYNELCWSSNAFQHKIRKFEEAKIVRNLVMIENKFSISVEKKNIKTFCQKKFKCVWRHSIRRLQTYDVHDFCFKIIISRFLYTKIFWIGQTIRFLTVKHFKISVTHDFQSM